MPPYWYWFIEELVNIYHELNVYTFVETFCSYLDESGNFKSLLCSDNWKWILSMYEAAYLLVEGENIFYEIRNFTTTYLKEYIKHNKDPYILTLVNHALELPLHWRMQRMETRWFIDAYESGPDINHVLLELAKLDFNMVQAKHQEDLESVSE